MLANTHGHRRRSLSAQALRLTTFATDAVIPKPLMESDIAVLSDALPWFFPTAAFIFGTLVGSFLNVCIYRIPAKKSVIHPGSTCACGQPIKWYDNVPVLSWFILRGKARC